MSLQELHDLAHDLPRALVVGLAVEAVDPLGVVGEG
jgi:hypothetical protein